MATAELLFETLRLRPRTDPDDLARAWSETRPDGLYPLADYERAAMWILRRLTETEAAAAAPERFVGPLRRHAQDSAARNLMVDAETAAVLTFLGAQGIPSVLIKGTARRAAGARYPCGDARSTSDVDLLLPREAVTRAWEGLRESGYARASSAESPHHAPALVGPGRVGVELHTSLSHTLNPDEAWRRANDDAREIEWNGHRVRIPAPTELLWHALSHALQHDTRAWRLRFFHDGASILAGDDPVAWDIIGSRLDANEVPAERAPRRWLDAAAQLAGTAVPPGIARGERPFDVLRALRWRLSVLEGWKNERFGGRLLEESTRSDLGISFAPCGLGWNPYQRARRHLASVAARVVYGVWRATGARAMRI